ncbi:molybdopterin molybdotransferase MoeA [Pseudomonas sp. C27(2019)]|uniref:molybdopterin molybdotransferase MoeA n=1 Tax=Pseudomonas sp. C27(2019) TaxID=2604941 RepID=UPI00124676E6|nr:gephyrin-like molybdotransferase Glp [Pseudomonas sp. C27(2019)]QEY58809.1 molybdopterin molybdotransferase MoeA [Pseudomonas sp. C27(2019)]
MSVCDQGALHSIEQAISALKNTLNRQTATQTLALQAAHQHVLAQPVYAQVDVPQWDNSAMDGYALRANDLQQPNNSLPHAGRIAAGDMPEQKLPAGQCMHILTGAPVPLGADTVVAQEDCSISPEHIQFNHCKAGGNIRRRGEEIQQGQLLLEAGTRLRAQEIGLLASQGFAQVEVYTPLRIGLLSSGNELCELGKPLKPGQIYDINSYSLSTLLAGLGFTVTHYPKMPDNLQYNIDCLRTASGEQDVLISSGGVSVGEEDHLKNAVSTLGQLNLWRVAIQPGKPLAFGTIGTTPWIGLPGNPAAALITALIIARPALLHAQGATNCAHQTLHIPAAFDWKKPRPRQQYLHARLALQDNGQLHAEIHPKQSSAMLIAASWADGLVEIKAQETVEKGDLVGFVAYSELLN